MLKSKHKNRILLIVVILFSIIGNPLQAESKRTLFVKMQADNMELDPAHVYTTVEAQIFTAIYEGLVSYHPITLEPIPAAATSWTISEDGRVYTFFLQPNGKYWNGETVIAEDFRDAWFRLLDPKENAEYSSLLYPIKGAAEYNRGEINDKEQVGIKVIDHFTLEVTLKEAANYFLKVLCHHTFAPINPLNLENGKWKKGTSCIGNGPFMLYSQSEDFIILRKNISYYDEENILLDEIKIILSNDNEFITSEFNKGNIQWAASNILYNDIEDKDNIFVNPVFGTTYFYFSTKQKPLQNADVRRALCLMLPWDKIRTNDLFYLPTNTLVPAISGYPKLDGIDKRNMQEALKLLYQAGFKKGAGIGTLSIAITESYENLYIAGLMKETWEKFLDVDVEIETIGFDEYFDSLKDSDYSIATTSWIGDFADPLTFLQMWISKSNLNNALFSNPEYDTLLEKSLKETDTKKRYEIMAEAEKILLNSGLVMPIKNYPAFNAVNIDEIYGWFSNILDIHPFKYISIIEPVVPEGAS